MNHTKEPWFVMPNGFGVKGDNGYPTVYAGDSELRYIAKCADTINIEPTDNLANAKRIVACVNACADLTNKHLNDGVIYRLIALQGLVHFAFGVELNKESKLIDEIIKISNEIHKILVNGEDV